MTRVAGQTGTFACVAALALVVGRAAPAHAAPSSLVTAPPGWSADPEQAAELDRRLAKVDHFDGLAAQTAAEAYVAGAPGVALFASRATAALPDPAAAPRAARAALDELRAITQRTALTGGAASEHAWQERVDDTARTVSATLRSSDPASHTVETARIVVVSDGHRIAAVTGECLAGDAADRALADACITQLASLDPGIAPGERIALAPARPADAAPAARPGRAASAPATISAAPGDPSSPPPRLDGGSRVTLPPMVIAADRPETDRRPIYLGGGLVVLAVVFWWNRRRRDRFEREEPDRAPRRARPRRDRDADADADDLRAAAHGDAADASALRGDAADAGTVQASPETPPGSDKGSRS